MVEPKETLKCILLRVREAEEKHLATTLLRAEGEIMDLFSVWHKQKNMEDKNEPAKRRA